MKFRRYQRQILQESLRWVRSNPNATNHDVPQQLRESWVLDSSDDNPPSAIAMTVFVFGYCQAQLLNGSPQPLKVSATEIGEKFQFWQMKLGLSELHAKTDLQSAAMPLFLFPAGEQVNFWADSPNN